MKTTYKKYFFTIAALLINMLSFSQTYIGDKTEINKILDNAEKFSKEYILGNHEAIANLYTENAKLLPAGTEIIYGKNKISVFWTRPESVKIFSHKITPVEIKIIGAYAFDYGYYEGVSLNNTTGEKERWKGKYTIIWKKQKDTWLMDLDIWNDVEIIE
ncbi:MAG: nuclear transport factor 2 family protein [Polaribacter sp.]|uniref:YybH family protein n=1 Tax=Polaribacter sp. TaxID=1920175 RepID=UPI003BB002B3